MSDFNMPATPILFISRHCRGQRRIRGFGATGETMHVPGAPGSWDLRYLPPYQKRKSLRIWLTIFGSGQILCTK